MRRRERVGDRRPHPVGGGRRSARARRADPGLEGPGRAARHGGHRGPLPDPHRAARVSHPDATAAAADEQSRLLHREPRRRVPLARAAGRGARRGNLSGIRGRGGPVRRERRRARCRDRRSGRGARRVAQDRIPAGNGASRALHAVRGRLSRVAVAGADAALRAARRRRSAEIRHRHQGAVAARARPASVRARRPQPGLAARQRDGRRLVHLSLRREPGRRRLRRSSQLRESALVALR